MTDSSPPAADTDEEIVRRHLESLGPAALADRLLAVARRDEGLRLGLVTEARAAAGTLDLASLKKQLTAQLRIASRHLHWRGSRDYAGEAEVALDLLDGLLAGGHPEPVIALAEHAIKRLDNALSRIDDSGGYLALPTARLVEIHHRACAAARPDPRKLAVRLFELETTLDWEWFLDGPERYADVLGDEGLRAFRSRIDREWDKLEPREPDPSRRVAFRRGDDFTITTLKESLARVTGNTDELVAVIARDLSYPYAFVRIAEELEAVGREREALAWLERGVQAFGVAADSRLRDGLIAAYLRDGQADDALALAEQGFDRNATAESYRLLERVCVAVGTWATRRPGALDRLRESPGGYERDARTEIVTVLLQDGDIDAAWSEAVAGGCNDRLWRDLAAAVGGTRPDDAAPVYRRLVGQALADTHHYREAVALLKAWRGMLAAHGREGEMAFDIRRLRDENRRRTKLIGMMEKAGFGPG